MGATKRHIHSKNRIEIANLCKALGHPARISIIEHLLEFDYLNGREIQEKIGLATATISGHLALLFQTGLIGHEVICNSCYYKIDMKCLEDISDYLKDLQRIDHSINNRVYFNPRASHN